MTKGELRDMVKSMRQHQFVWVSLVVVMIVNVAAIAWADIAPRPGMKNRPRPMPPKLTGISMKHEIVRLRVTPERWYVHVVFTMSNYTASELNLPIGFPATDKDELQNFTAKVGDEMVVPEDNVEIVPANSSPIDREFGLHWKRWSVKFPAKSDLKIEVRYETPFREQDTHRWEYGGVPLDDIVRSRLDPQQAASLLPKLEQRQVHYVLTTGAEWDGQIGHCEVEVQLDGMSLDNVVPLAHQSQFNPLVKNDKLLVWEAKNIEPRFDVTLRVSPLMKRQAVEQLVSQLRASAQSDAKLGVFTANYEYAKGRDPEAKAVLLQLYKDWQHRVVLWGPESRDSELVADSILIWRSVFHERSREPGRGFHIIDAKNPNERQMFAQYAASISNRLENQAVIERPSASIKSLRPEFRSVLLWSDNVRSRK